MRDDLDTILGVLLATGAQWAYGDTEADAALAAAEWELNGFTPAQVQEWVAARVWWPEIARVLADAGHDAKWAAVMSPETEGVGAYLDTRGYKLCNGDLDLADVAEVATSR